MIPVRLSVRNFMCYRDDAEVLDLTGVHLACLSGENGAGKSALLEAITWVLWGRARDRAIDDELIAKGATDMEVDLLFMLGGDTYRVIRKRAMKGKSGTTLLDLQLAEGDGSDGGAWRTLSGSTVRESQARINDLLKIDYDTFKNSAFLMQGKADEFTIKTPTDRKKVLADILGLQQYDRLEEQAKAEAKDRLSRITDLNNTLYRINLELDRRPQYEADLKVLEEQLEAEQEHLAERRTELAEVTSREQELEHSRQRLEEIRGRITRREHTMDQLKVRIVRNDERKKALQGLLARRAEIERGYAELQELGVRDEELLEAGRNLSRLQKQHGAAQREVDVERTRLESEANQREREIADLKRALQGRPVLEQQLAGTLDKVNRLVALQAQHEDTRCEREALDVNMRALTTERDTVQQDGTLLRQKLDLLEKHFQTTDHAGCPLCGTALTEDALQRVRDSYEKDIADRRREYTDKVRELEEINRQIVSVELRLGKEREDLRPLEDLRRREAEQRAAVQRLDEDEQKLEGKEADLAAMKKRLFGNEYAHDARERLAALEADMAALSYDEERHMQVRARIEQLRESGYESQYHQLESAEQELAHILEELEAGNTNLGTQRVEQESDRAEELKLTPQLALLAEVQEQRAATKAAVDDLAKTVHTLAEQRGELRNSIAKCDEWGEEKRKLSAELQQAQEEQQIYNDLSTAFGKKGIQAMIIENIIPEVEEEANTLLHRMTDGRMSVQFVTQKDAKTVKSVIETLDIEIADEIGTRSYEMYSGGEAFRVNFAVRIALSKLLARRAGTQLQTLVIDEGFGSQDGQGRDKLVGAIRSIQDDFEKILVITHIEELKDAFPTRINIVKTNTGSRILMQDDM